MKKQPQSQYYLLKVAAKLLGLSEEDAIQFVVTGQLIAAFVYHKPSDYQETREVTHSDGSVSELKRTNRTELRIRSPDHHPIEISYLTTEDAARILLNKIENREILVSTLFFSNELTPKNGRLLVGESAVIVSKEDLVITREELHRFAKVAKIRVRKDPIEQLSNTYRPWYDRPIGRTGLAILAIVIAGVLVAGAKTFWL